MYINLGKLHFLNKNLVKIGKKRSLPKYYIHRFVHTICTVCTLRSTKLTEDRRPTTLRRLKPKRRVPEVTKFYEYTNLTFGLRPSLVSSIYSFAVVGTDMLIQY